jgi:hypothetical protein
MPKVSKETAAQVMEFGPVIDRREEIDGSTIELVSFGAAGTELLQSSPTEKLAETERAIQERMCTQQPSAS